VIDHKRKKICKKSGDKIGSIDTQVCLLISDVIEETLDLLTSHVDEDDRSSYMSVQNEEKNQHRFDKFKKYHR